MTHGAGLRTTRSTLPKAIQMNNKSDLIFGMAILVGLAVLVTWASTPKQPSTVYVGTDCQGASSVAVARTSFDLPPCASIEVHQVAG